MPRRTGRLNIGHATGRGVLPDERTLYRAMLVEKKHCLTLVILSPWSIST
ncbi:hypothetical protein [Evansella tamaricis]|uniref:Uncharacterized protein n=1 Tax=Evansella tamaricis TaxID=2069301 RepID=A0ABS6JAC2_9BACI|nr:hypothetical protein [Evansella tamaricis]MBU9710627.1 hypothetical protein [Evansella tamaricis]